MPVRVICGIKGCWPAIVRETTKVFTTTSTSTVIPQVKEAKMSILEFLGLGYAVIVSIIIVVVLVRILSRLIQRNENPERDIL